MSSNYWHHHSLDIPEVEVVKIADVVDVVKVDI
jgi:hypothetical protein